jgi:hypothetical protein
MGGYLFHEQRKRPGGHCRAIRVSPARHSSFVVSFAKSETAPQGRPTYQKDNARQRLVLPFAAGFALAVAFFGADFFAIECSFDLDRERSAKAATSNQPYHDCKANADILYGAEPVRAASAG